MDNPDKTETKTEEIKALHFNLNWPWGKVNFFSSLAIPTLFHIANPKDNNETADGNTPTNNPNKNRKEAKTDRNKTDRTA